MATNIQNFAFNILTRIDMACFILLAVWPSKSGWTPSSEKLCDVSTEWREKAESKIWKMGHERILLYKGQARQIHILYYQITKLF
jgi:hypothetical protein